MDKDQLKAVVTKQNLDYYESIRERHLRTTDIPVSGVDREWQALRVAVETNKISLDELREHIGCPPFNESRHWERWEDWRENYKGRPIPAKKVIDARALPASTDSTDSPTTTPTKRLHPPRYGKNRSKMAPAKTDAQLESLRRELKKTSSGSNLSHQR